MGQILYDPMAGRFISKDPIGFNGGINLYAAMDNNPLTFTDPYGECPSNFSTDWKCKTVGPGKLTDYVYQAEERSKYQGVLLKASGKCDNSCPDDRVLNCTYNLTQSWQRRKRAYNKTTKVYGGWSDWNGYENRQQGVVTLQYSCKDKEFVGGALN